MAYAKVVDGVLIQYPYTEADVRRENPNTSFPRPMSDTLRAEYNMVPVTKGTRPADTDNIRNWRLKPQPELVGSEWKLLYEEFTVTAEVQAAQDEYLTAENKRVRDRKLLHSDWTQGNDSPLTDAKKAEWRTYRQALRDITTHENWPDVQEDWPQEPS